MSRSKINFVINLNMTYSIPGSTIDRSGGVGGGAPSWIPFPRLGKLWNSDHAKVSIETQSLSSSLPYSSVCFGGYR